MVLAVCVPILYLLIPDLFYGNASWYVARHQQLVEETGKLLLRRKPVTARWLYP